MSKRLLVSFEGGEGCGKSTQMRMAIGWLEAQGLSVVSFREPGGVQIGEKIRGILLDPKLERMEGLTELLLYIASRHELVGKRIRPSLAEYDVVVLDRYIDSTTSYQGYARGIDLDTIQLLNRIAIGDLLPDLTILLDIDPVVGLSRAVGRDVLDRMEQEDISFHQAVRNGFLAIAEDEPERVVVVDAAASIEEVYEGVKQALMDMLYNR